MQEYVKHQLIDTPLEPVVGLVRHARDWLRTVRHPELRAVYLQEPDAMETFIRRVVAVDTCCADVGAHIGSVSGLLQRLAPRGSHLAVEPTPYKAAWLRKKYPRLEVVQAAVGREAGTARFFHQPDASGYSGLRQTRKGKTGEPFDVEVKTLDAIIPESRRLGFLKIDVEGGELDAFRGAPRLFSRDRPAILFECTRTGLNAFGQTPGDVHAFLMENLYDVFTPSDFLGGRPALDAAAFEQATQYPFRAFNFVALPRR